MSDNLKDNEIQRLFDVAMSSEPDRAMSDDDWGDNIPSDADDTDNDLDFIVRMTSQ